MTTWEELLDRFERDLDSSREPASWHPPAEPLPAELADRAREVLRRQQEHIAVVRAEQDAIAHQLVALRRVPDTSADVPAFLDVAG
ncbi:hypothetical protein Q9R19_01935 [Microbacterium sp. ARD32]|uniref:hypothetical protein n=1 Tax=Microbacterium sp. ARD32 TaxID=2962577 RepID=UPI00288249D6|nr:hypothetical protein [Microbacterium sp. ARD32]MDT0156376.1 hypothetical protein [Microbacterium sp. ARD32]